MKINFKFLPGLLALLFAFSAIAFGQGTTGSIEGTVTDPQGGAVPNATVTIRSVGTTAGYLRTVTADATGYVNVQGVPPGEYNITVSAANFAEKTATVTVSVDKATNISTALAVAGVTGVVDVVTDSAVTIDNTSNNIDTNITKKIFESLPAGTGFTSLLKIAPNVRPEALAAGFQIDGASAAENVFVIDGQEVTNFRTGQLNSNNNLPFALLQEVQVKSTGFNAEYGGATGGVINAVTAGGGNEWHANVGVSLTPNSWAGDPRPFLNRFDVVQTPEYFQPPKDGGVGFFPVASLSGPIVKDKLWFSVVYAPQILETRREIDYFTTGNNPNGRAIAQTQTYISNVRTEEFFVRLDAQPTSNLRLYGTFLWNPIVQKGVLPTITDGLNGAPQSTNFGGDIGLLVGSDLLVRQGGRQNANSYNFQATYTPTNAWVINFRHGKSFLNEKLNSYFLPTETRFQCVAGWAASTTPGSGCTNGFQNIGNNFQINYDVSTRTTFDADAAVLFNAGGQHNLKFGYQWNRLFNTVDQGYVPFGIVSLYYGRPITALAAGTTATPGFLGSGILQRFGTVGEASSTNQGVFVQDTWQINN